MIIHHSIQLLKELHEIESHIKQLEELVSQHGIEIDSRAILTLLLSKKIKNYHTALTDTERVS